MKVSIKHTIILPVILFTVACKTQDPDLAQAYKRKSPAASFGNPNQKAFLEHIDGTYFVEGSTEPLVVDNNGSFTMKDSTYSIQNAIAPDKAVYVAATKTDDGRTLYTYHGIVLGENTINTVSFKNPSYEAYAKIDPQDSPHAWEINTFREENINWEGGFYTPVASRIN